MSPKTIAKYSNFQVFKTFLVPSFCLTFRHFYFIVVRLFEPDEIEYNVCCVPQCIVSRNTLGKWRLAAMDLYKFPHQLPMTLYVSPEEVSF